MDIPAAELIEQVKTWRFRGLLSEDSADALILDIQSKQTATPFVQNRVIKIISIIGSVLIGGGILLFIASNWSLMTREIKVGLIFGALIGFHWLGRYLQKRNPTSVLPNLMHFIATAIFAGGIFLLGQIFHIDGEYADAFFWIMVGSLPLAYAIESALIMLFAVAFGYAWFLRLLFLDNLLVGWYPILFVLLGFAFYTVGELQERLGIKKSLTQIYTVLGSLTVFAATFVASFEYVRPAALARSFDFADGQRPISPMFYGILLACVSSIGYVLYLRRREPVKKLYAFGIIALIALLAYAECVFVPADLAILGSTGDLQYILIANLAVSGAIVLFFLEGVLNKSRSLVNLAVIFTVVLIIARYVDYFASLFDRSLAFIIGGLILTAISVFLEQKRKELYQKFGL